MEKTEILAKIKESKKYKQISDEAISKEIEEYIKRNPKFESYKDKKILKDIKAELHKISGSFQISANILQKRTKLLEELRKDPSNSKIIEKILETNRSTKERFNSYKEIYDKVFQITGKPKSILDLGCGLNPIYYAFMNLEQLEYYAYDINQAEIDFLNEFFKISNINGKAKVLDLANLENVKHLPKADICLMFKFIDPIEKQGNGHKLSEEIIKILIEKCKFIVVSFSTKTLGNKKMNFPYRGWIERMLERIELNFNKIDSENEVFYVLSKKLGHSKLK